MSDQNVAETFESNEEKWTRALNIHCNCEAHHNLLARSIYMKKKNQMIRSLMIMFSKKTEILHIHKKLKTETRTRTHVESNQLWNEHRVNTLMLAQLHDDRRDKLLRCVQQI